MRADRFRIRMTGKKLQRRISDRRPRLPGRAKEDLNGHTSARCMAPYSLRLFRRGPDCVHLYAGAIAQADGALHGALHALVDL